MPADTILYLCEREVRRALESIDVVEAVAAALTAHGRGETTLPAECGVRKLGSRSEKLRIAGVTEFWLRQGLQLPEMAALARQLVGFDPQLADEVADHLNARAATIDAAPGRDELAAKDRARRYRTLAEPIRRERTVRTVRPSTGEAPPTG